MTRASRVLPLAIAALLLGACSSDDDDSAAGSGSGGQTMGVGSQLPAAAEAGSSMSEAGSATTSGNAGGGSSEQAPGMGADLDGAMDSDGSSAGDSGSDEPDEGSSQQDAATDELDAGGDVEPEPEEPTMSFFVTSRGTGNGGNFGGIEGADAFCAELASEASAELGAKTWRAYLSTSAEDARDRIGAGPWRNAAGVVIANSVEQLHDQGPGGQGGALDATWPVSDPSIALDEQGNAVQNDVGVRHDIITGTNLDGTVSASGTCSDWTSEQGTTRNGHSDRQGGGQNPPSWNSSHDTGCAEPDPGDNFAPGTVAQGGGRGAIYCFAID